MLELDGERILNSEVEVGYLHRGFEKTCENRTYFNLLIYTDRLNYVSPLINNLGYALTVEKLLGLEVPERAQFIRVLMSELSRISDHLTCLAAMAMECGAFTAFLYKMKAREFLWDVIEQTTGARMTTSYHPDRRRPGRPPSRISRRPSRKGVGETREVLKDVHGLLDKNTDLPQPDARHRGHVAGERRRLRLDGPCPALDRDRLRCPESPSLSRLRPARLRGPGGREGRQLRPLHGPDEGDGAEPADHRAGRRRSWSGPARASWPTASSRPRPSGGPDAASPRRPVQLSPNLEGSEKRRPAGDPGRRPALRRPGQGRDLHLDRGPDRPFQVLHERPRHPAARRAKSTSSVEGGNGELGYYIVSDGTDRPYRLHLRAPCFHLVAALEELIRGRLVADVIPTFGSMNMIGGELDR